MSRVRKAIVAVLAALFGLVCWWGVSSSPAKTQQKAQPPVQAETAAAKDKAKPKSTVQKLKVSRAELLKKLKEGKQAHSSSNASEKAIFDGKTRQEQKPLPASGKDADLTDAPCCSRYPNAPVRAYRTSALPSRTKGGPNGELREWLVTPSAEGYELHLEETWYPNDAGEMSLAERQEYVANQVTVTVDGKCTDEQFAKLLEPFGAKIHGVLMNLSGGRRIMAVMIPAEDATLDSVIELTDALNSIPYALSVGKDAIMYACATPNDPRYSLLWGMTQIKAEQAWNIRTDASSVLVAVVDSGVNYKHPDLVANMWSNPNSAAPKSITLSEKYSTSVFSNDVHGARCIKLMASGDPMDDQGHGTHVAGTIGAVGNNGKGVSGVAWKVKLMALKAGYRVETDEGSTAYFNTTDVVAMFAYAKAYGANIVNCSFGGNNPNNADIYTEIIQELRDAGIIVVCAAGNGDKYGNPICNDTIHHYPSDVPLDNVVSVAASTKSDTLVSFSNYGVNSVDIAAPGSPILSCCTINYSSSDGYSSKGGTSMATPHVTGALALLKAHYPNEGYQSLIQRLYSGVDKVAALSGKVKTGGRLNVLKALNGSSLPKPVIESISRGGYSGEVRLVSHMPNTPSPYYRVLRAPSENAEPTSRTQWTGGVNGGSKITHSDADVDPGVKYYYRIQFAKSANGDNASPYSDVACGWASSTSKYPDLSDPADNQIATKSRYEIFPTHTLSQRQKQGLNAETDPCDWFDFTLIKGERYLFETVRSPDHATDTYGELYQGSTQNVWSLSSNVPVATDDNSGTNKNFRIVYTPKSDVAYHFLKVSLAGEDAKSGTHYYQLRYKWLATDEWDTTDDTPAGATELTPTVTEQTHGQHSLDAYDSYDFFKVKMTAGKTYVFETTGSGDTYGEIFDSTLTNNAHCVAFDDDGGTNSNFKIIFTPKTSQTYYLRVRPRTEIPITGKYFNYSLKYSMVDTSASAAHDLAYLKPKTWSNPVVLTRVEDDFSCQYSFTPNDRIYLRYAYHDAEGNTIGSHTNMYMALRRTGWTSEYFDFDDYEYVEGLEEECGALSGGYFREVLGLSMNPGVLNQGEYAVLIYLDSGEQISETDEEDNIWLVTFTMVDDTDKKLTGLEIRGSDSLASGASGKYAAYAKYDDGSSVQVEATWSSTSGHATMDGDGTLRVRDLTADAKATVTARYTEDAVTKTATKDITLYAPRDVGADPFGDVDPRPEHDMSVYAEVTIDGEPAQENDVLAAYVGDELRGRKELNANGRGGIVIYADDGEQIEFRVWSRQNDETYTAVKTLAGVDGGDMGDPDNPYRVECASSNPFGIPVANGTAQMSIRASVAIKGEAAESGDVVGVFCGDELRDVGVVYMDGKTAAVRLSPYVNAGETLTFMVWDASAEELLKAKGNVSAVTGGSLGTDADPHLIEVSDEVTLSLTLDGSATWQFVSVNVVPEDNSPRAVFGSVLDDIMRITCDGKLFNPSWGDDAECDLTAIEPGKGYWVKRKTSGSVTQTITGMPADVSAVKIGLKKGWNAVGYVPQLAGNIRTVFTNALAQGIVLRISDGNGNLFFPSLSDEENSLTEMRPGNAYWVKASGAGEFTFVEPSGSSAASALAALSAASADSEEEHPFGTKRDVDGVAGGIYLRAKLDFFGTMASYGEAWVAAYVQGSDVPCDVKSVNMAGTVVMGISKSTENAPLTLTFKVYDVNSGRTYTAANTITYAIGEDGKEWDSDGAIIKVTGTLPTYQVVFDLNGEPSGSGVRTGGGSLTQTVSRLEAAIAPTVKGNPGFEFQTWDADFSSVKGDMTVHAVYQLAEIEYATVTFNANGGTLASNATNRTIVVGSKLGTLPSNPTRSGYTFAGWWTSASGGTQITTATVVSASVTYYAHWTADAENDLAFYVPTSKGWTTPLWLSTANDAADMAEFTTEDTIYCSYAYEDVHNNAVGVHTNYVSVWRRVKWDSSTFDLDEYEREASLMQGVAGLESGKYASRGFTMSAGTLGVGEYAVVVWLDCDKQIAETDETNNIEIKTFTVVAPKATVTFNANGGTLASSSATRSVTVGSAVGSLPSPTRSGYTFAGWYTSASGGTKITTATIVSASVMYYAHWTADAVNDLAFYVPTSDGWTASPWLSTADDASDKSEFTTDEKIYGGYAYEDARNNAVGTHTNYVAVYQRVKWESSTFDLTEYESRLGLLQGVVSLGVNGYISRSFTISAGRLDVGEYAVVVWLDCDEQVAETDEKNNIAIKTFTVVAPKATVTFNANGGTLASGSATRSVTVGSAVGSLPTPTRSGSGYTFAGWWTSASGGTKISTTTVVSADVTYYAHWTYVRTLTVKFDPNGGRSSVVSREVEDGKAVSSLPTATRTGYKFRGWYTLPIGGEQISDATVVTDKVAVYGRVTYYAQWAVVSENTRNDLEFFVPSGVNWTESMWLTDDENSTTGKVFFKPSDTIYIRYAYRDAAGKAVDAHVNRVFVLKRTKWNHATFNMADYEDLGSKYSDVVSFGEDGYKRLGISVNPNMLETGSYAVRVCLDWNDLIDESNESNNEQVREFTVGTQSATVKFNANGGSISPSMRFVAVGTRVGTLPVPWGALSWNNHVFTGWYTSYNGSTRVTADTVVTGDVTYYAHWRTGSSDSADFKDNTAKGAVNWPMKNTTTSFSRTLMNYDAEDNFKITGKDGALYDISLALDENEVGCDAVFSITNANGQTVCDVDGTPIENVTSAKQVVLPKTKTPYYLTVRHGTAEKRGGSYIIYGQYADVGSVKFAKTAVNVKESAAYVDLTVNRTGKNGRVRVKYATAAHTAQPGEDYVPQSGVLEWADGDKTAKKIRVTLIPDLVAKYDGVKSKSFNVTLTPFPASEQDEDEYPAVIAGGDTCTVTIAETSKPGTTVESVYAKQAAKRATVKTEVVPLESGTFYGLLVSTNAVNEQSEIGSLTFTASSAAVPALSAKATIAGKTYSFKGKGWLEGWTYGGCVQVLENVTKFGRTTCTNTLYMFIDKGWTFTQDDWHKTSSTFAALDLNVMDEYGDIQVVEYYSMDFYRNNAKIQSYLDVAQKFAGYYTVSLAPRGCVGNGYLTLTIDNKGNAKVAGMLPDGVTKPSVSVKSCGIVPDSVSANGYAMYVPIFMGKATSCFGGTLRLVAERDEDALNGTGVKIVVDEKWDDSVYRNAELIWNNTVDSLGYCDGDADGAGFGERLTPYGGWYDKVVNLQAYYLNYAMSIETEYVGNFPTQGLPDGYEIVTDVSPAAFTLAFENDKIVHDKKKIVKTNKLVDFDLSVNPCNVSVKFTRATGLFTGGCSVWSENWDGTKQKEITGFKSYGVFLLNRMDDSFLDDALLAPGFITKKYRITGYDDWTGRKTTHNWSFSAPFNVWGEEIDRDWSEE